MTQTLIFNAGCFSTGDKMGDENQSLLILELLFPHKGQLAHQSFPNLIVQGFLS